MSAQPAPNRVDLAIVLLRSLGAEDVSHAYGEEIRCRCFWHAEHRRADARPSLRFNAGSRAGLWQCMSCGRRGNLRTLEHHFGKCQPEPYVRRSDRCGGSMSDLFEQTAHARTLLDTGATYSATVAALRDRFRISTRTAKYRIAAARGSLSIAQRNGKRIGLRMVSASRLCASRLSRSSSPALRRVPLITRQTQVCTSRAGVLETWRSRLHPMFLRGPTVAIE